MKKVKESLEQAYKFYAGKGFDETAQVITFELIIFSLRWSDYDYL